MQRCCTMHLRAICRAEVERVLIGKSGVCERMRSMKDANKAQLIDTQITNHCADAIFLGNIASHTSHINTALSEPLVLALAAHHHAVAARREHNLPRTTFDEYSSRQKPEAAQPTGEEVRAIYNTLGLCQRDCCLPNKDCLTAQERVTLHAMSEMEAIVEEQRLPLPPAQQRTLLSDTLRILDLSKQPPAVCHTKGVLVESSSGYEVVHDQHPTSTEELLAIVQRVAHKWRCVQHICANDDIALMQRKSLKTRVHIDIEQLVLEEWIIYEAHTCLAEEDLRDIGEDVQLTRSLNDRKHA